MKITITKEIEIRKNPRYIVTDIYRTPKKGEKYYNHDVDKYLMWGGVMRDIEKEGQQYLICLIKDKLAGEEFDKFLEAKRFYDKDKEYIDQCIKEQKFLRKLLKNEDLFKLATEMTEVKKNRETYKVFSEPKGRIQNAIQIRTKNIKGLQKHLSYLKENKNKAYSRYKITLGQKARTEILRMKSDENSNND